jgi:hypothetical protein
MEAASPRYVERSRYARFFVRRTVSNRWRPLQQGGDIRVPFSEISFPEFFPGKGSGAALGRPRSTPRAAGPRRACPPRGGCRGRGSEALSPGGPPQRSSWSERHWQCAALVKDLVSQPLYDGYAATMPLMRAGRALLAAVAATPLSLESP